MATEQASFRVLLFPYLAHGHISPFLELARKLKDGNFDIYFCSTPVNLKSIASKLADCCIQPVELHLPSSPDELPPEYHSTNGLPPHLIFALVDALQKSGPALSSILESVQPDLLIYDISQPWLPPIAADHGVPAVFFQTTGATALSFILRRVKHSDVEFPSQAIDPPDQRNTSFRRVKVPSNYQDKALERYFSCLEQSNEIILVKTSRGFEGKYIDFYSSLTIQEIVPVGGLVRDPEEDDDSSEIIQWLNEKQEASTVYVCFGSECFLSKEEIQEIAVGLELSGVGFIWVVRTPNGEKKTSLEEVLPEGLLGKVKERGLVVEGWAPQAKILKHQSIGGFVSHCGWGSLMESIRFGVPIIAMPMQYDQPVNARLVVETGFGLEVVKGGNGQLKGEEIARTIKQVLVKDSGEAIRRKARELAEEVRVKSEEEIDAAVHKLTQICQKNKKTDA